jgi:cephalosporin-C deacetylase-like acetyl esterase
MARMALAIVVLLGSQQQQQTPADQAIRKFLKADAEAIEKDFFAGVKTAADFEKLRPALRDQYFDMLGLKPLPEKTPLKATVTGTLDFPNFTVEKLHYQSKPGLYVTANLYAPKPNQGRHPAILYSIGHYNSKRDGHKTAVQDHGIWFATHGYVCLLVDTIELGEVTCTHHGTYSQQRWWWHSAGFTPAAIECWNAIRGIDYLQSRPDVDPERIGATGISGGGAATFWISAADERVKASAPVSGMADLTWYIGEDGVNGHCDCMFLYNNYRWNWTAIAALVAPRPLLFVNSDNDGIFPMPANERIINRLERLYSKFGASDKVDAVVSVGGHAYRTDLRRSIFEFFNRTLKNDAGPVTDADSGLGPDGKPSRIPGRELRVFPEDKDIPADQLNTKIDEVFVPTAKLEVPKAEGYDAWRTAIVTRLRELCFPAGMPLDFSRPAGSDRGAAALDSATPCLVVLDAAEDPAASTPDWAKGAVGPSPVILYRPRSGWTRKNPPNTIERSHVLLGGTVDSARVLEIADRVRSLGVPCSVVGRGQAGILAAYAALLEPKIQRVTVLEPTSTHRDGPHFLSVLRVCDIPEALGCLAPRPLTIIGGKRESFDRTAEIYRIAGAADKLERK